MIMIHGGDIYRNEIKLDFSVNINPLGIPAGVKKALTEAMGQVERYPDIRAERLVQGIAGLTGTDKRHILCGNGASELFMAVMHGIRPKRTLIPVPSFWGYEHAAAAADSERIHFHMAEGQGFCLREDILDCLEESIDLLILANPNNPVGNLIHRALLEQILQRCLEKGIIVVVDECFIEFTGREETDSLKDSIERFPNLILVRAFTKIFAVPGVRLGYLLCANKDLLARVEKQLPEWNLSVFAQAAGLAACAEQEYILHTIEFVGRERGILSGGLRREGIGVYPSETNYLLLYSGLPLYEGLLKENILIRDCSNFDGLRKGYYRVAVRGREENTALLEAVRKVRENGLA